MPSRRPTDISAGERVRLREFLRYDPLDELPALEPPREVARPRTGLVIALTFLSVGVVLVATLAVSFAQVTSPRVALPALERVLATLTEIDGLLVMRAADVQTQLEAGRERLTLPDFPIADASVARTDAVGADGVLDHSSLRSALLAEATRMAYERGPTALGSERPGDGLLSGLLIVLTQAQRTRAGALTASACVAALVLAALLLLATPRRGLLALGAATIAAGLLTAGVAMASGGLLGGPEGLTAGTLRAEETAVARTLLEIPTRNGVIVAGLGVALAVIGVVRARTA